MQKIATRVFVAASMIFGVLGVMVVLFAPDEDAQQTTFEHYLMKAFFISIFVILTSFALSVAGKYLHGTSKK